MTPTTLASGVNRLTLGVAVPANNTSGVANDASLAGIFIFTRVPIRIWQMNNADVWSELDILTGEAGSRISTVYFDDTEITRIFLQSTGEDNVVVRAVRRETADSNVAQDGVNNQVHIASSSFLDLTDTPSSFAAQAGKYPRVNNAGTMLEFVSGTGGYTNTDVAAYLNGNLDSHIIPDTNATYDIGTAEKKIRHLYLSPNSMYIGDTWIKAEGDQVKTPNLLVGDINLNNEGRANEVDGTNGHWSIQEGSDDLFLINRKTGKKYRFNITEIV